MSQTLQSSVADPELIDADPVQILLHITGGKNSVKIELFVPKSLKTLCFSNNNYLIDKRTRITVGSGKG